MTILQQAVRHVFRAEPSPDLIDLSSGMSMLSSALINLGGLSTFVLMVLSLSQNCGLPLVFEKFNFGCPSRFTYFRFTERNQEFSSQITYVRDRVISPLQIKVLAYSNVLFSVKRRSSLRFRITLLKTSRLHLKTENIVRNSRDYSSSLLMSLAEN